MITKKVILGLISITDTGIIQVRHDHIILEDDVEVARTYHRYMLMPGDDVIDKEEILQRISVVVWTPEIIEAYKILKAKQEADFLKTIEHKPL